MKPGDYEGYRPPLPAPEPLALSPQKTALAIIDMQNDFIRENGEIYVGPMVKPTIPKISSLLEGCRKLGMLTIFTRSWFAGDDPRFTREPRGGWIFKGCKEGTWGVEIIDELKPLPDEPVIEKSSYDCWFRTNLEEILSARGFGNFPYSSVHRNRTVNDKTVIVTGTASNSCVEKAVIGFFLRGFDVVVPVDCISTFKQYDQELALYQFVAFYRAKLTTADQITFLAEPKLTVAAAQR